MFIIKTFTESVPIDFDELLKLRQDSEAGSKLIFFRQGAVNPGQIVVVIEDIERKNSIKKRVGESEEDREARIREMKSPDLFASIRISPNMRLQ